MDGGPLPSPQDVVLRLDTDLGGEGGASGPAFYTDANGREFLRRDRGARSTWVPAPIAPPYANPIGRDYYPTTVGAYLEEEEGGAGAAAPMQVSLLGDRAQGAASLAPGAMEAMLHREAETCDELGNPETLKEREGGAPVVVRGVSVLSVTPARDGAAARRALAVYPLVLLYAAMAWLALVKG